jgi:hypothetical protein
MNYHNGVSLERECVVALLVSQERQRKADVGFKTGRYSKVRNLKSVAAIMGVAAISVLGLQGAAGADSGSNGYPGTTVTANDNGTAVTTVITQAVGSTFTETACGFAVTTPPGTVTFTVDGGTLTASSEPVGDDGCVTFTGTVTDPHLSIDGGPAIEIAYGNSTITASGIGPNGNTVTATFTVPVAAAAAPSTPLAFTGADIMAMVIGGLALVALGFLVVTFARRRKVAIS